MRQTGRIMVVEDDEIISSLIQLTLEKEGYVIITMTNAESAWKTLKSGMKFDAVLLDRGLPDMDGMVLLRNIKADSELRHLTAIFETSLDDSQSVREGLEAGAYYYLTKPLQPQLLVVVVNAALEQQRSLAAMKVEVHEAKQTLRFLDVGTFHCRTIDEARDLARGLANACPDPEKAILGLVELMINAVEHGNLGIGYSDKTRLMIEDCWQEELDIRATDPTNISKHVTVDLVRQPSKIKITIQDEGDGFAWENYMDLSSERAFDPHGRGIAMARMQSFDSIEYQGNGNTVTVTIDIPSS